MVVFSCLCFLLSCCLLPNFVAFDAVVFNCFGDVQSFFCVFFFYYCVLHAVIIFMFVSVLCKLLFLLFYEMLDGHLTFWCVVVHKMYIFVMFGVVVITAFSVSTYDICKLQHMLVFSQNYNLINSKPFSFCMTFFSPFSISMEYFIFFDQK